MSGLYFLLPGQREWMGRYLSLGGNASLAELSLK